MMDKANRLMDSLDMAEAICCLKKMTGSEMDEARLLRLCASGRCSVYLDCLGRCGQIPDEDEPSSPYRITGQGLGKILKPIQLINCSSVIELRGPLILNSTKKRLENAYFYITTNAIFRPSPRFKPADIEALAARMNDVPDYAGIAAENDDLRRELANSNDEMTILRQQLEQAQTKSVNNRDKPSHLLVIAALLNIIIESKVVRRNQSAVISEINTRYPNMRGLGSRTLDDVFSVARKAINDANNAQ